MQIRRIAKLTGHNAAIFALAPGEEERYFLSSAGDGWIVQWDFENPDPGRLLAKVDTQVFSIHFLKSSNRVVAGNMNGGVHWVDLNQPHNTKNIAHHQKGVFDIREMNGHIYTIGGEGKITRWSVEETRSLESYQLSNQSLRGMSFSKKRNEIAVGSSDKAIFLLDATTLELRQVLKDAHNQSVFSVCYSPDDQYLLSGGRDAHLNVWALEESYKKVFTEPAHWFTINHIVFHPQGHLFATASRDKTLKIWDAKNYELQKVLEGARDGGHFNSVNRLYWAKKNNMLVSCGDDRSIILWEIT
jgi:WD40 repeat protein